MRRVTQVVALAVLLAALSPSAVVVSSLEPQGYQFSISFVGNTQVDFTWAVDSRYGWDHYVIFCPGRPDSIITDRETTFYRLEGLVKGVTYQIQFCSVLGSGSQDCTSFTAVTPGQVRGQLSHSLTWPADTYRLVDSVQVMPGATLTISSGAVIENGSSAASVWVGGYGGQGGLRADGVAVREGVSLALASADSLLQNTTIAGTAAKPATVTLGGGFASTVFGCRFDYVSVQAKASSGAAVISGNVFHESQLQILSSSGVQVLDNTFDCSVGNESWIVRVNCQGPVDIDGNTFRPISWNYGWAIRAYATTLNIRNNRFLFTDARQRYGDLVRLESFTTANITGNLIAGPEGDYIWGFSESAILLTAGSADVGSASISDNVIERWYRGVYIEGAALSVVLTNNSITDVTYAIVVHSAAAVTAHQDCLVGYVALYLDSLAAINVDATNCWWGDPSGPNYEPLTHGPGSQIQAPAGRVAFQPFLTQSNCEEAPPEEPRATGVSLEVPAGALPPDGHTQAPVVAIVRDQYGNPLAGAVVSFSLSAPVGQLAPQSATTGSDGRATVTYTVPAMSALTDVGEVTVVASSGAVGAQGVIRFREPAVYREAEPRYHQAGWNEWHALLPPDPQVLGIIKARLTLDGEPVAGFPVTLTVIASDGAYDGEFVPVANPIGPQDKHQLTVATDPQGWVVVNYKTNVQASRSDTVLDEIEMRCEAFGYLAAWIVETGMDLEIVDLHRSGERMGSYVVLGQPEPLEIEVRDRLHPSFLLANYNDNSDPIMNPDADYVLGVRLDISHAAGTEEFLRLVDVPYVRVPKMTSLNCYFYSASGKTLLLTSAGTANLRPYVTPWIEGASMYWLEVHFQTGLGHELVQDTYPPPVGADEPGDGNNNYRVLAIFSNENLDPIELFFQQNPCGANDDFTRTVRCTVSILSILPGADRYFGPASTALDICEVVFSLWNGEYVDAYNTGSTSALGEFVGWLQDERPDLLSRFNTSMRGWRWMKKLDRISSVLDCYWAAKKWGENGMLGACAAFASGGDSAQLSGEMDLWVQALLENEGTYSDALAVVGPPSVQLVDGLGHTVPLLANSVQHDEANGYYSLSTGGTTVYLLPPGSYALTVDTSVDTTVLLYRRPAAIEASSRTMWQDDSTASRRLTIAFGAANAGPMAVDEGSNGSVERYVAPTAAQYVANPTGLSATALDGASVRLAWQAVSGAAAYEVSYGTESRYLPLFGGYQSAATTASTSLDIGNLALGATAYYFSVTAVDGGGSRSLYSAEVMAGADRRPRVVNLPLVYARS